MQKRNKYTSKSVEPNNLFVDVFSFMCSTPSILEPKFLIEKKKKKKKKECEKPSGETLKRPEKKYCGGYPGVYEYYSISITVITMYLSMYEPMPFSTWNAFERIWNCQWCSRFLACYQCRSLLRFRSFRWQLYPVHRYLST